MNTQHVQMMLTGVVWGMWPIVLRKSGLNGNVASAAFSVVVLAIVSPFALSSLGNSLATTKWIMVIAAGMLGASGMLMFNDALAKSSPEKLGILFIIMMTVQIAVPAIYQMFQDGKLTTDRAIGFGAAFVAAFFLTRSSS